MGVQMAHQKQCPRCGAVAQLSVARCANCGHVFRTNFLAGDQTQMIPGHAGSGGHPSTQACQSCGQVPARVGVRYCSLCGYDFQTGKAPARAPAPPQQRRRYGRTVDCYVCGRSIPPDEPRHRRDVYTGGSDWATCRHPFWAGSSRRHGIRTVCASCAANLGTGCGCLLTPALGVFLLLVVWWRW